MKKIGLLLVLLVSACDSGVDTPNSKPVAPTATVINGVAAIGVVSGGTVTAYDFNDCTKGDKLAEASLVLTNTYGLTIEPKTDEQAILLELTNFSYTEESSKKLVTTISQSLYSSFVIQAGINQNASVSYWTNLAHARTTSLCNDSPELAVQTIQNSNNSFSDTLLFDIIEVLPQQIESSPLFFTELDPMKYGVANASISFYTYNLDILSGGTGHHEAHTSIDFATKSFSDLAFDKMLDGNDASGQITIGATAFSADTYRTHVPNNIYYTLAANDISPEPETAKIAIIGDSINLGKYLDVFPEMTVVALTPSAAPKILDASYIRCPYNCASPIPAKSVGCNACWTIATKPDMYKPCEVTLEFDIEDPMRAPYTITGQILNGETGTLSAIYGDIDPADGTKARFHLKHDYTPIVDSYYGNLINVAGQRELSFVVTNIFGQTKNFSVAVDSRIPQNPGMWYNMPYTCGVNIL